MNVTPETIKSLRERTGAGIMDCKKALLDSSGNLDSAIEYLRKKGLASAVKKADRTTSDGSVISYIHAGGKIGVLVEINCETDFVARTDDFQSLCKDVAMHIAAANPLFVKREDVDVNFLEKEKNVYVAQAKETGKPDAIIAKIVEGKIDRYYSEICLLEQNYVKDPDKKVQDIVSEKIAKLGENITIKRFARFQLGESISKTTTES